MLAAAALILMATVLPGYALCRILDGSADKVRKMALSPALGLLLMYGCSGLMVLTNIWSWGSLTAVMALLNVIALALVRTNASHKSTLTPWQKLERAMHGEVYGTPEQSITEEAATQSWLQQQRKPNMLLFAVLIPLSCLTLPLLQDLPFGVDWIGFSMLTAQMSTLGDLTLPGTNGGFWTYPPAFPSVAAWLQQIMDISPARAVFILGHYSLFTLIFGIGGAMDRHGAGAQGILAMGLGIGLFAKVFDSGYPTVASQLGLVVGLLVLLRPSSSRGRHHTLGFIVAFLSVAMIHPTGAIYLGMLMLSHILIGLRLQKQYGENIKKILYASSILLTASAAIALLILAPRMLDAAVFAEYGWQGGRPLLTYNALLLILGLASAFKMRKTVEGQMLSAWFCGLWILTSIHLIDGLGQVPVLSLLSYTLYSMGLHAFHIPLAALVALWWSDSTSLTPIDSSQGFRAVGWDPCWHRYATAAFLGLILIGVVLGNAVLYQLSEHDELRPITNGDLELVNELEALPEGSIVYSENAHWGYVYEAPSHIKLTSIPTLGLVQLDSSIQALATSAVYSNNVEQIQELNITYAISSPIGTIGWHLAQSSHWDAIAREQGSALWQFNKDGDSPRSNFLLANESHECTVGGEEIKCSQRIDPWADFRFRDPLGLGDSRIFVPEGTTYSVSLNSAKQVESTDDEYEACVTFESVGDIEGIVFGFSDELGKAQTVDSTEFSSGWHRSCISADQMWNSATFTIQWEDGDVEPRRWMNPLGFSGRGDVLFDCTGIRLHWYEMSVLSTE